MLMDPHEAELLREIQQRRKELVSRAEAFRRTAIATFDPREGLRRHPLAGVLTSLGAGVLLALLPMIPPKREPQAAGARGGLDQTLISFAAGLLPGALPALMSPLLSLLSRPRASKEPPADR